ncbi:MMPL domain protein [Kribbella flavida DSM 17836]|uniref:MMPL domain protein n=1 Tax=Kribbella flavida (strain DSM 17836 / JCM 10339 / NBRC 14399) TaxID=479435 RepID=D2PWK6_KRIFD|nr:MMPL family transporter [Kribbella flavida]ADB33475.1 MMPL domain protein [Kribbella flavida DSM 17836]
MSGTRSVLRSRRSAALVLLGAFAVAVLVLLLPTATPAEPRSATGLSTSAESARVEQLRESLPKADETAALIVFSRPGDGRLSEADRGAVQQVAQSLRPLAPGGQVAPVQFAENGQVALVVLPLPAADEAETERQIDDLRGKVRESLPSGVDVQVTGPPAFTTDLTRVFDGADIRLLVVTAAVVALLLLLTYRSPGLVLVPLIVVALTEQVTTALSEQALAALGLPAGGQVTGITSVLVFGATTDYALLLIARYREQLRATDDALAALRTAVGRVAEPVLASGGTVIGALAILLLASTETLRGIAVSCIIGIALAMCAGLLVLPAALAVFGRGIFWPFVPRVGDAARDGKIWGRLGGVVARRPVLVLVASTIVLAGCAAGTVGVRTGLAQNEQFRVEPESVRGAKVLAAAFPAGTTEPVRVIGPTGQSAEITELVQDVDGVASVRPGSRSDQLAQFDVVLTSEPGSAESFDALRALRSQLDAVSPDVLVGGGAAESLDLRTADRRDQLIVIPLVLLLVGLVLVAVLRSLLAPFLLLLTVVASFFASFGASWLIFDRVLGFPALDGSVLLLSFLFLVALGVDYNIFLSTRAREEARTAGTRAGMRTALAVTGGVITSAGLLLAAVFAVLGVLPLITLTQVGVIVCVGVLLDTLLVRTVVVPALAFLLGDRFWWPGRPVVGH